MPMNDTEQAQPTPDDASNVVTIGAGADVEQIAVGSSITQTKIVGYTVEQVSALLTQIRTTFQPKPFDGRSPYVGLAAFEQEDADRFFGRERWVANLVERLRETRYILIGGASGSGKSSLARAGLLPALKKGALPGSEQWLYATFKPGRDPLEQLALAVTRLAQNPSIGDYLRQHADDETALHKTLESLLSDRRDQRAVLLVDQFEEIFTQVNQEPARVAFLNLLTHAATVENGRTVLLCTLRSDFVSSCSAYPKLNALLNKQFVQVTAMEPDELVSAIARPALQVGVQIDPDLVAQIINDMRGQPGALPLMQFALKDLFDAELQKGGVIALTRSDYLERGGIQKALERHADAEFAKLSPEEQTLARSIFSGVVEIRRATRDTRRTARLQELIPANANPSTVKAVVEELATARLLTTDEQGTQETVTLAHETLIDAWSWLRRLIDENRDAIALQNAIAADAQEWQAGQRDASYLYTGARLATAREQLAANKLTLTGLALAFVQEAIAAQDRAQQRRRNLIFATIGGLTIAVLVFAFLAFFAFQAQARAVAQEQTAIAERNIARSRELAAIALNQITINPERALLIALEANKTTQTFESLDALRQTLLAPHARFILKGHTEAVNDAQFSPDGALIVTASVDKTARVWDANTGQQVGILQGHTDGLRRARFSPDGTLIATASADKTARVWDAKTFQPRALLQHDAAVNDLKFSSDGKFLATASEDGTAHLWDPSTGGERFVLRGHTKGVAALDFSRDGTRLVTLSKDNTARVWDTSNGQSLFELKPETGSFTQARFSRDGKRILTAGSDNFARMWDASTGRELFNLAGHDAPLQDARFSPDDTRIVTASGDGTARVWDAASGLPELVLRGHEDGVFSARFTGDGSQIVTTSRDSTIRVWDALSGEPLTVLRGQNQPSRDAALSPNSAWLVTPSNDGMPRVWDLSGGGEIAVLRGHRGAINNALFSPDGARILTASRDDTARIWNSSTFDFVSLQGHTDDINAAQFSNDSAWVATASADKTARLWDARTGALLKTFEGHTAALRAIAFSHDNQKIVTTSNDSTARVWDTRTGQMLFLLRGHTSGISAAQFSPDGKYIVTASNDKTARLWDAATGNTIGVLSGHEKEVLDVQFAPDSAWLVTASGDGTARVWDVATQQTRFVLRGHNGVVRTVRVSPNGKWIVTAGNDSTARVWDATTGALLQTLRGHNGVVMYAEFSPDNALVVTASTDGTARIWDATTGQLLSILRGNRNTVLSAHFSPDGQAVLTGGQDNSARLYVVAQDKLLELARSRVNSELSCAERAEFLNEPAPCATSTPKP